MERFCKITVWHFQIHDGNSRSADLLARLCGYYPPAPFTASGNVLYLEFNSDHRSTQQGFQAHWSSSQVCGGALVGNQGSLQAPNTTSIGGTDVQSSTNNTSGVQCVWTITADPDTRVNLTISFQSPLYRCQLGMIEIRDGNNRSADFLMRRCGNFNRNIVAKGNSLFIFFLSNMNGSGQSFQAQWSILSECSRSLTGNEGTIQSPGYSGGYYNNARCVWTIATDPGTQITLKISIFDSYGFNCRESFIDIRDGNNSAANLLRRLCSSSYALPITATGNVMFIEYRSVSSSYDFQAHWSTNPGCGQNLAGNEGTVESPYYPQNYYNGAECTWTIRTDPGTQVLLTFYYFRSEYGCSNDYLVVRDGDNSTVLSRSCGSTMPAPIRATGNIMFLEFRSNNRDTSRGFQAQWSTDQGCGEDLTGDEGTILSANITSGNDSNVQCVWTITTDPGTRTVLNISASDQIDWSCRGGVFEIRDGNNRSAPLLRRACRNAIAPLAASGNVLYIFYRSDEYIRNSSFEIKWSTLQGCRQNLIGDEGVLQSPYYPSNFISGVNCVWTITTSPGTQVTLTFSDLRLGTYYNYFCTGTGILIRDGINSSATFLTRICGNEAVAPITATSNVIYISFISSSRYSYNPSQARFQARWSTNPGCRQALNGLGGTFQSPNYPNNYDNNVQCVWTITTFPGTRIMLNFSAFDLQNNSCRDDFLSVSKIKSNA
ncbi:cubilin [Elysia marginata]|uniref:Cubilin n=1 Tax=Elysia marginata TaxID=1093978 RepID=A0AAV4G1H4_9GAST|nr:cubilin [Elysia marginata]